MTFRLMLPMNMILDKFLGSGLNAKTIDRTNIFNMPLLLEKIPIEKPPIQTGGMNIPDMAPQMVPQMVPQHEKVPQNGATNGATNDAITNYATNGAITNGAITNGAITNGATNDATNDAAKYSKHTP